MPVQPFTGEICAAMAFNECLYKQHVNGESVLRSCLVEIDTSLCGQRRTTGLPYAREAEGVVCVQLHNVREVSLIDESTALVDDVQRIQSHLFLFVRSSYFLVTVPLIDGPARVQELCRSNPPTVDETVFALQGQLCVTNYILTFVSAHGRVSSDHVFLPSFFG